MEQRGRLGGLQRRGSRLSCNLPGQGPSAGTRVRGQGPALGRSRPVRRRAQAGPPARAQATHQVGQAALAAGEIPGLTSVCSTALSASRERNEAGGQGRRRRKGTQKDAKRNSKIKLNPLSLRFFFFFASFAYLCVFCVRSGQVRFHPRASRFSPLTRLPFSSSASRGLAKHLHLAGRSIEPGPAANVEQGGLAATGRAPRPRDELRRRGGHATWCRRTAQ